MLFDSQSVIELEESTRPKLQVVVDTEEEFDWTASPDRSATSVSAMRYIERVQTIFDDYHIKPCYVVDYPVASQPEGYAPLKSILEGNRCEIGAHLQPWVNPPFDEELSVYNMYPGNLEGELEEQKLRQLSELIERNFGSLPRIYKAGRYGLGYHTIESLDKLGFDIDLSVCPPFDNSHDGGPDYSDFGAEPFWFCGPSGRNMLELPVTGGFVGSAGGLSKPVYNVANMFSRLKAPGLLSRLSVVDRLMLSPEGFSSEEHKKLTISLLSKGIRTFTWSFHSPSVVPGHTPYVTNKRELERFLDSFKIYFDYFFDQLEGEATSPTQLYAQLALASQPEHRNKEQSNV